MKSVLISIQPYWVFLIIAETMGWSIGKEKTIEVRKNYPKDENWDKVAKVYCSKNRKSFAKIPKEYQPFMEQFLGKVVGEFYCNKVENIEIRHFTVLGHENRYTAVGENPDYQWLAKSCLSYDEVVNYGKLAALFGWHISNLVIYDKPKDLDYFRKPIDCHRGKDRENCKGCWDCEIKRPPQSWCYVETKG